MGTLIAEPDYNTAPVSDTQRYAITAEPQLYTCYVDAVMTGTDVGPTLHRISELPLEQRYVWRVALGLACALRDFEPSRVAADRETLKDGEPIKVIDLLRSVPFQLGMFLSALVGDEAMERKTGCVDFVLTAENIAREIVRIAHAPRHPQPE